MYILFCGGTSIIQHNINMLNLKNVQQVVFYPTDIMSTKQINIISNSYAEMPSLVGSSLKPIKPSHYIDRISLMLILLFSYCVISK